MISTVLSCQGCQKRFNTESRVPMFLDACQNTVCKECLIAMQSGFLDPDNPERELTMKPKSQQINCLICKEQHSVSQAKENLIVVQHLQSCSRDITIVCDSHQTSVVKIYCQQCNQLVCLKCSLKKHNKHSGIKEIDMEGLVNQNYQNLEKLQVFRNKVDESREQIHWMNQQGITILASEFLKLNADSKQLINFKSGLLFFRSPPLLQNPFQLLLILMLVMVCYQISNHEHYLTFQSSAPTITTVFRTPEGVIQPNFVMDQSTIPEVNRHWNLVQGWIGEKHIVRASLIYRGSRDGFTSKEFHRRCDNSMPKETITFIKSELGYVFGGYTPIPWISS